MGCVLLGGFDATLATCLTFPPATRAPLTTSSLVKGRHFGTVWRASRADQGAQGVVQGAIAQLSARIGQRSFMGT
eukprot:7116498-Pyramimonas_sp.AAC.1